MKDVLERDLELINAILTGEEAAVEGTNVAGMFQWKVIPVSEYDQSWYHRSQQTVCWRDDGWLTIMTE